MRMTLLRREMDIEGDYSATFLADQTGNGKQADADVGGKDVLGLKIVLSAVDEGSHVSSYTRSTSQNRGADPPKSED